MFPRVKLAIFGLLLFAGFSFALPSAETDAASAVCNIVNGLGAYGPVTVAAVFQFGAQTFDVGDTVTITHTGTATHVEVEFPQGTPPIGTIPPGGSFSYTIPTTGISSFRILNTTGLGTVAGTVACRAIDPNVEDVEVPFIPGDDRINHHVADRAAPVALYCHDGGIQAIRIDPVTGAGSDEARVSANELEAAGIPAEGNVILAQLDWVILARLADTRFSAHAWYADGKPYTMTWVDCNNSDNIYLER